MTTYKVVGSSCMKDFTGHSEPESVLKLFSCMAEAMSCGEEFEDGFDELRADGDLRLSFYLNHVAAEMRVNGWMSKSSSEKQFGDHSRATASRVSDTLEALSQGKAVNPALLPTEGDCKRAQDALDGLAVVLDFKLEKEGTLNDYLYNLSIIRASNVVTRRTMGLAASIIATAERELQEMQPKNESAETFFGTVGERLLVEVTVESVKVIETSMGFFKTIIKFSTARGSAVWFMSGADSELAPGARFMAVGTVKGHNEFKGKKETVLSRVETVPPELISATQKRVDARNKKEKKA